MQKFLLMAALGVLSACVAAENTASTPPAEKAAVAVEPQPIKTGRAASLLQSVCGKSLKDNFSGAPAAMASEGFTQPSPVGSSAVYSKTEDASFSIQSAPNGMKICSFVFSTTDSSERFVRNFSRIGRMEVTNIGPMISDSKQRAVVFIDPPRSVGGVTYYGLKYMHVSALGRKKAAN